MADEFWRHFDENNGGYLSDEPTDERIYQPWRTTDKQHGSNGRKLLIHNAPVALGEFWRLSCLQSIDQHYDPHSQQFCWLFRLSGLIVFLQGYDLMELDDLIEQRRVRSIHVFDPEFHYPIDEKAPFISKIIVEQSS